MPGNGDRKQSPPHRRTTAVGDDLTAIPGNRTEKVLGSWMDAPRESQDEETPDCTVIGPRYRVMEEIARGGMGAVIRCRDTLLARDVAVKVLLSKHEDDNALRTRFVREARIVGQLQHPGIIPIYDLGETVDGRPFFAMKLIEGESFADLLQRYPSPHADRGRQINILAQVCHALAFAHERGVVHLDLKPSNIMIGRFGAVQLMDWGLARVIPGGEIDRRLRKGASGDRKASERSKRPRTTVTNESVQGTPAYMSPEHARGQDLDVRADVFGIGAIICEILTGRPPYSGELLREVYARAARASLDEAWDGLDTSSAERPMVRLAKGCLAPDRENRPKNAGEIADFLDAYMDSALQTAESDLRRFFDLSLDLFCIANTSGFFLRINGNFSRVLGFSEEELIAKPFMEFVHPDDQQPTIDAMSALSEGDPVIRFRNRYRHKDGRYLLFEWTAKSVPEEQTIYAVARDVSEDA